MVIKYETVFSLEWQIENLFLFSKLLVCFLQIGQILLGEQILKNKEQTTVKVEF